MPDSERSSAEGVKVEDLNYIAEGLSEEFARMAGGRLLLTGGAGFLGYYLVQAVLHHNHQQPSGGRKPISVTVYDNFARGLPDWLAALRGDTHLTLKEHDVTRPLPEDIGAFEYIIHAASIASPLYYRKHPIQTMDANVGGLRRLLEYARQQKEAGQPVKGFLFFSTSEIYGDPPAEQIPTPETYRGNVSCTGPRACYDESKRYGETLCVNFAQQYGLPVTVARPFNNYGPGLKITDRRAPPDFARDVLEGRDLVMLSDGSPTRTFCYVADAVTGYYKVLVKGRAGEAYNIGTGGPEITIRTLAERMVQAGRDLFGYEGGITFQNSEDEEYLTDNPSRRCPSIEKARRELEYEPNIELDEGLRRSLLWYRDHQHAEAA